jgi:hypothetical protein
MEASAIENIKQEIIRKRHISSRTYVELKPASKYAYYNPAKKDKDGNISIRQRPILLWITGSVMLLFCIINLLYGDYKGLIIPAPILVVTVLMIFIFPSPYVFIVHKNGMTIENKEYLWKDYIGVFYFIVQAGKSSGPWALILIREDGSYDYVHTDAINNFNKISTAIRDFQPPHYKNLV